MLGLRYLLPLLNLIKCCITKGVLEWTVVGKVTDYGQNVTLFCNVPNCCPKDAGWDRWTPVQRTLYIDVKSGRANKKYDGKVLKDGYTLIIQNLTKNDLNVSYSCLYGVTFGERKLLLEEDVFKSESTAQPNRFSAGGIAASITGFLLLVSVSIWIVCWRINRTRNVNTKGTGKEKRALLTGEVRVTKEKYSRVCGTKVELEVEITDGSTGVTWLRDGKTLKTSSPTKYVPATSSKPSLEINDLDKNDIGTYVCKVVYQTDKGMEEEIKSRPIVVNVIEVVVSKEKYSQVYGSALEIEVHIPDGSKRVTWYLNKNFVDTSSSKKYAPVNVSNPSLNVYGLGKADIGSYVCKVVFVAENGNKTEEEIVSPPIEVELKEPVFLIKNVKVDFGDEASIHCKISNCPEEYEIYWEKEKGKEFQSIDTAEKKYCLSTKENPHLTIKNIYREDAATHYRCCMKSGFSEMEYVFKSNPVKLCVSNEPVVEPKNRSFNVSIGNKVCIECRISHIQKLIEIYWQKMDDEGNPIRIEANESTKKYEMFNREHHNLTIKDAEESDDGYYCCCVKYASCGGDFTVKSERVRLNVDGAKILTVLENIKAAKDETIPKNIRDQNRIDIDKWIIKDSMFVSTRASDFVIEYLNKNNCVTLTGSPGVGKSFVARHAAINLQKKEYDIIPVQYPEEIKKYYQPGKRMVFVVDDMCGNFTAKQQQIENWELLSGLIEKIVADKFCKIIVSVRLQVFKDEKFSVLTHFKKSECNLVSNDLCLTSIEKKNIAEKYIDTGMKYIDKSSQYNVCFPLWCSLCHNKKNEEVNIFFKNPFLVYEKELNQLCKQGKDGNRQVCSLALCVLFNNHLREDWFQGKLTKEQETILEDTCTSCKLNGKTSKEKIKKALDTLDGSFIRKQNGIYSSLHDKLFDIFANYFGKKMKDCLITHGDSDLICERFVWNIIHINKKNNEELTITIPNDKLKLYLDRLVKDWSEGKVIVVFNNNNMKNTKFRKRILAYLNKLNKSTQKELANIKVTVFPSDDSEAGTSPLIRACYHGYTDIVTWMLHNDVNVDLCRDDGTTGLHMACQEGYNDIVIELLLKNSNVDLCDNDGCSPLYKASQNGHTEIVKSLLGRNPNVDLCKNNGSSPLLQACHNGHTDIVVMLLDRNPDINLCNNDGCCPLIMACRNGHTEIVRMLLDSKPNINICEKNGSSPLILASHHGNTNIVRLLLEMTPDIDLSNRDNWSSLNMACQGGFTDIVQILLDKNPSVNLCNNNGCSPLFTAIQRGHTNIVLMLLERNPDVDLCNSDGLSPLYIASQEGHTTIVEMLLAIAKSPNVNLCTKNGCSPLYAASQNGHTKIARMLLQNSPNINLCNIYGNSSLYTASQKGNTEIVRLLLQNDPDIDVCNGEGCCPLFAASTAGHTDIVEMLLKKDSKVNLCNSDGCSPLFAASQIGNVDIVRMLLQKNPKVDLCNSDGCSPLYVASQKGYTEIVCMLLKKDPNIDACNIDGCCSLYAASTEGHTDIVQMLLEKNPNVDLCCSDGCSPLYVASQEGYTKIVDMLLERVPDIDICNIDGCCPLYAASMNGHTDIVRMLLAKDPKVKTWTSDGCCPLYAASQNGHLDVVRMLLEFGIKVDICDNNGCSPLFAASQNGHTNIVIKLLEKNSNVNFRNNNRLKGIRGWLLSRHRIYDDHYRYGCSSLYMASRNGHTDIVKLLLENNADINLCDQYGCNSLFMAIQKGHTDIVRILLVEHPNVDLCAKNKHSSLFMPSLELRWDLARDEDDCCENICCSPLHTASNNGHTEIVKMLLEGNASLDVCEKCGCSPLHKASANGYTDIVRILLEKNPNVDLCDYHGCSPLKLASQNGHSNIVEILLGRNPNVDLCDNEGNSPLFEASQFGYTHIVQLLLDKNPKADQCNTNHHSSLCAPSKSGHIDTVGLHLERSPSYDLCNKNRCSPLYKACANGHPDIVSMLLGRNPDVDQCDNQGCSPLFIASQSGHTAVVKILLDASPNIDLCNEDNCSPLYSASKHGYIEIVRMLLDQDPDVNLCNNKGCSPLYKASKHGQHEIVRMLLEKDPNVDLCHNDGSSPLMKAIEKGHTDIVRKLLDKGSNVNQRDKNGYSPLIKASESGNIVLVRMLLRKGPDINLCDNNGSSPLKAASINGHTDIVRLLLENNPHVDLCDNRYGSSLLNASQKGHTDIVRMLLQKGANVNLCTLDGYSPLIMACANAHIDIVLLLFEYKPDINAQTFDGGTALYLCALKGHKDVTQMLLEKHAHPGICIHSKQGMIDTLKFLTGITLRQLKQHLYDRLVQSKLSKGIDYVKKRSIDYAFDEVHGCSPLHIASFMGRMDVVQCLLTHNANIDITKDDGTTPLFYACEVGNDNIVRLLLDKGADTQICRLDGTFPLNIATDKGHTSIVMMVTAHMTRRKTSLLNV